MALGDSRHKLPVNKYTSHNKKEEGENVTIVLKDE